MYKNKIKEIRLNNNLTQKDIAEILNISRGRYSEYETEYDIMPLKYLNEICNYFNISLDYIFDFTDTPQYQNQETSINKIKAGSKLKEIRKELKLTQKNMAEILNTVHPVISKYEKGINLIATPFLYTICKKYKISADYLLGKIDSPKYYK